MAFIQARTVKWIAWLLLQWANWISSWLIKLVFSKKSTCNRLHLPWQLLKTFVICLACFPLMYLWTKKPFNCSSTFLNISWTVPSFLFFLLLGNTWPVNKFIKGIFSWQASVVDTFIVSSEVTWSTKVNGKLVCPWKATRSSQRFSW